MKNTIFRWLAYSTIGLLAIAALNMEPPAATSPAALLSGAGLGEPEYLELADTLGRGETLSELFSRMGLGHSEAIKVIQASSINARAVPEGLAVTTRTLPSDSLPSRITLQLALDRLVHVERVDTGWVAREELLPWTVDTVVVAGEVRVHLYQAMDEGASEFLPASSRNLLTTRLADIYEYRVDMSRDLQPGDRFRVLFERRTGPGGAVKPGQILAANMLLSGREVAAVYFSADDSTTGYYDQNGNAMKAGFLQTPLKFSHISSNFGRRLHPILGTWRQHAGTDYAAAAGTPVRAIGDGRVTISSGTGYGNLVEIRHKNGFVSRYAHLRSFARGVSTGAYVTRESVIGYVGQTGLATGPHLHFEVLVGGQQRNPRVVLREVQPDDPISAAARPRFVQVQSLYMAYLGSPVGTVRLAQIN